MNYHDISEIGIPPPAAEASKRNRSPIDPPERAQYDRRLAQRLGRLGADPWTKKITVMLDLKSGERFHDVSPHIENWLFAGPAKERAAEFNLLFSAYCAQVNTTGFRAYTLRLPLAKAALENLAPELKGITALYGTTMDNAKRDGLARPIAVFVHPRWDDALEAWDLHLHCIADVEPGMEDDFFLRLATKFSTPKDLGPTENIAAFANYCSAWVLDHRELPKWPKEALLEFWKLKAPQLIRKAGDFAAFVSRNKNKRFRWEGDLVVMEEKQPRQRRQNASGHPLRSAEQVSYVEVRIGGRKRQCAILKYDRDGNPKGQTPPERPSPETAPSRAREKPTTTTGSIPSTPVCGSSSHRDARRLSRRLRTWETIWPWGTSERPPGPIRRRLIRAGVVTVPRRQGQLLQRRDRP